MTFIVLTLHPAAEGLCTSWRMHEYDTPHNITSLIKLGLVVCLRLFPPDAVSTLSAILPGLHAGNLSGQPAGRSTRGGKGHDGGIWKRQPWPVCHRRQVRLTTNTFTQAHSACWHGQQALPTSPSNEHANEHFFVKKYKQWERSWDHNIRNPAGWLNATIETSRLGVDTRRDGFVVCVWIIWCLWRLGQPLKTWVFMMFCLWIRTAFSLNWKICFPVRIVNNC